ncbi:MAG: iron ABC transporter permease [Clostridiaceae bacterium]|nr:iron ABC transporter permease [Clostridiaceae bacterium]
MKMKKINPSVLITAAFLLAAFLFVASLTLGSTAVSFSGLSDLLHGDMASADARILLYVRLPRTIGALFAGIGLAGAGVLIQNVLHNPLAGPSIIGINAGAGFFAILCIALSPASAAILPFYAFFGALAATLIIYAVARRTGASRITIILAGVAVNALLSAGTDAIHTFSPDALLGGNAFRVGSLASLSASTLILPCILITLAFLAAFLLRNELDILSLGEDIARSLGLRVGLYRFTLLVCAAVLAGASVSFAGLIGFIGLIVPHSARLLIGNEAKALLPLSALLGASLLLLCDILSRVLFAPYEIPVGILTAFIGAPIFLRLLFLDRKHRDVL